MSEQGCKACEFSARIKGWNSKMASWFLIKMSDKAKPIKGGLIFTFEDGSRITKIDGGFIVSRHV